MRLKEDEDQTINVPSPYRGGGLEVSLKEASRIKDGYILHVYIDNPSKPNFQWYVPVIYKNGLTIPGEAQLVWGKSDLDPNVMQQAAKEKADEFTRSPNFLQKIRILESFFDRVINRLLNE